MRVHLIGYVFMSAEGPVGGAVRDIQAPRANYNARFHGSSSKCWLVEPLLFPPKLYLAGCLQHVIALFLVCFGMAKTDAE